MNARTDGFMLSLHAAVEILPAEEELREFLRTGRRQESVGSVLYPGPWQRGHRRLAALLAVVEASLTLQSRWQELRAVAADEADPDQDQAQLEALEAFRRAHQGGDT